MPLYMYQASYTPESIAAQIKEPQDRIEAVRPFFAAMGAKIVWEASPSANTTCWSSTKLPMTAPLAPLRWL